MNYTDERLYNTKNNILIKDAILESYDTLYRELLDKRNKYHPYDYAVKVLGLYYTYKSMKELYKPKQDFSELLDGITEKEIQDSLDMFSLNLWKDRVKNCVDMFNDNPAKRTPEFLSVIQSVIRYGALYQYAKEKNIISTVHKYGKSLVVCQNILTCRGGDIEQRKQLRGIYKYLTIHIQSICALIDENKVDNAVFGFLSDILEILYNEQHKSERYKTDGIRRSLYKLFSNTLKVVSSQDEYIKADIQGLYNVGITNVEGYKTFVEQVNPQYSIILFADRLFNDVENFAYILLNPSKTNIQILSELEYQFYREIYPNDTTLLAKVKTVNPDNIKNMDEVKEITDKWIREILSGIRVLYSIRGGFKKAEKAMGTNS